MTSAELYLVIEEATVDVTVSEPGAVNVTTSEPALAIVTISGDPGPRGAAGNNAQIFGEIPSGTCDGVNVAFVTSNHFVAGSTAVYRNGIRESRGLGYAEVGADAIHFSDAPLVDDDIRVDYLVGV